MKELGKSAATWLEVGEESESQRIDNFLLRRLKGVPKSHVYRVLRSGEVRVNSGRIKPDYRLRVGDKVRVPPIRTAMPKTSKVLPSLAFPVVFEDESLLVIDKPSGTAVHGGSGVSFGVIESLRAARPQAKMLELAHRLDRDTSGLLIIAKKRSALVELHRMLREGEVEKIYVAVVKGRPAKKQFDITEALHKYVNAKGERRVAVKEGGMEAVTRVRAIGSSSELSALRLHLMTGRTHQIRVHLAHAGHPIIGDDKYGDFALNKTLKKRLLLHAARLSFTHPVSGERLKLESRLPRDFTA
jgi:23S rRNA pseudouridine955/2504/2580 synthase